MSDRPTHGARFRLERTRDDGAHAVYACTISTPELDYACTATLADDGTVALVDCPAPRELAAALEMFAKLTARSAPSRRAEGRIVWPARVLRWRAPK